jgi:AmiR/NasT family two-component response regulator
MRTRAVIEQAKGIFMATHRISADKAFQALARASQRENRKLNDIAQRLVDTTDSSN